MFTEGFYVQGHSFSYIIRVPLSLFWDLCQIRTGIRALFRLPMFAAEFSDFVQQLYRRTGDSLTYNLKSQHPRPLCCVGLPFTPHYSLPPHLILLHFPPALPTPALLLIHQFPLRILHQTLPPYATLIPLSMLSTEYINTLPAPRLQCAIISLVLSTRDRSASHGFCGIVALVADDRFAMSRGCRVLESAAVPEVLREAT
jgi:hypothetical protein